MNKNDHTLRSSGRAGYMLRMLAQVYSNTVPGVLLYGLKFRSVVIMPSCDLALLTGI